MCVCVCVLLTLLLLYVLHLIDTNGDELLSEQEIVAAVHKLNISMQRDAIVKKFRVSRVLIIFLVIILFAFVYAFVFVCLFCFVCFVLFVCLFVCLFVFLFFFFFHLKTKTKQTHQLFLDHKARGYTCFEDMKEAKADLMTFDEFCNFFKNLSARPELFFLMSKYATAGPDAMNPESLRRFLEIEQGVSVSF